MSALTPFVGGYDHVLLDLDGCVWVGEQATERAVEAIAALRAGGTSVAFVTNDARHGEEELVRKLWRLGFKASVPDIVTSGGGMQHLLAETAAWRSAYVIGASTLHRHVAEAGVRIVNRLDVPAADVVVVGAHDDFDYRELRGAVQSVLAGAALVCTDRDATFPQEDGPWPGTGALVAAVEAATGVQALAVGKPEAQLFRTALDRLGPGRALVIGDRLDADLAGAHAAGLDGAIVLTGATSPEEARAAAGGPSPPVAIAPSLATLLLGP